MEKLYSISEAIQPIDACITCVIKFNVTAICIMIFHNKYTNITVSFACYMVNIILLCCVYLSVIGIDCNRNGLKSEWAGIRMGN